MVSFFILADILTPGLPYVNTAYFDANSMVVPHTASLVLIGSFLI